MKKGKTSTEYKTFYKELVDYAAMSMITVKKLNKRFGRKSVINELDLEVEEGEFLVMFGPNGAGKTTLIKILSTLSRPLSGSVEINGYNISEESLEVRNNIGVLSHNPFLYDDLTLKENLTFYSRMFQLKKDEDKIKFLAHEVGLFHRLNDRVGQFSRGMKQRAAVARAILHDPPVLLLDEPFTGLDYKAWGILMDILKKFHGKGKTILLITHNVELGHKIGERLTVLVNGKIALDRKKTDIGLEDFKEEYHNLMGNQK
ncbi:MAG: heme ABC exporter ATP-binding protein CcmA [Thermoplasmata archaeon]|nr:MAG: heme ABC exporter ATP-binding protein CcmA [Thermoplasmata archaeon]